MYKPIRIVLPPTPCSLQVRNCTCMLIVSAQLINCYTSIYKFSNFEKYYYGEFNFPTALSIVEIDRYLCLHILESETVKPNGFSLLGVFLHSRSTHRSTHDYWIEIRRLTFLGENWFKIQAKIVNYPISIQRLWFNWLRVNARNTNCSKSGSQIVFFKTILKLEAIAILLNSNRGTLIYR